MPDVLITGSTDQMTDVAGALRSQGFDPVCADSWDSLADVCATVQAGSLDCYVQLPARHPAQVSALAHLRAAIAEGPLARLDTLAAVAPLLAKESTVLLVLGDEVDEAAASDLLRRALGDIVRVMADALLDDHGAIGARAAVVGEQRSPHEIAALACRGGRIPPPWTSYAAYEPDASFGEWRLEAMRLASERC